MKRIFPIDVRFYRTANGREPVREFLYGISKDERKIIGADLEVVQWRWPTGEPLVKKITENSIYELRSTLKNRIARILNLETN